MRDRQKALISRLFLTPAGCLLAFVVPAACGQEAHAQAGLPYLADPGERDVASAPVPPTDPELPRIAPDLSLVQRSRPRGHPPRYFLDLWTTRRQALAAGGQAQARSILAEIVAGKQEAGWPNMFACGEALTRESAAALTAGRGAQALDLAQGAVDLAPDLPRAHLALAAAQWKHQGAFVRATGHVLRAGWKHLREPPLRRETLANVALAWASALAFSVALFSLAVLYRHVRTFSHDVQHLLASVGGRWLATVAAVALVLSPVVLGLGPLWAVLVWCGIMAWYFDVRERIGAVVAIAYLSALPFSLPPLLLLLEAPTSRSQQMYDATVDMLASDAVDALRAAEATAETRYTLGMRARWSGELEEASRLLAGAEELGANDPDLLTTLGNVRFWLGDANGAVDAYRRAIAHDADNAIAYFNLSRVYYAITEHQKAGEAFRRASSLDYEATESYAERAKKEGPGFVVSVGAARRLLGLPIEPGTLHRQAGLQLWQWVGGGARRFFFAFYGIATALLVILVGWLRRLVRPSAACGRCGQAACWRCNPELPDQHHCGQCYHAFVAADDIEAQVKIQKEIEVRRYQARTRRVRGILAVLLVGSPDLLRGESLRGLLSMATAGTLFLLLCGAMGWLPMPVHSLAGFEWITATLQGSLLAVV